MRWWRKSPKPGDSKTWGLFDKTNHSKLCGEILYRLMEQCKKLFRWPQPEGNPYLRTETSMINGSEVSRLSAVIQLEEIHQIIENSTEAEGNRYALDHRKRITEKLF
ncbi:TPA: hypothetical protein GF694_23125 [Escherichia coli]|nr:hypothetical protein A8F92_10280 [Escherichia coli]RCP60550.1 hypothetical protein A6574_24835 [Escherichia coli]HAH2772553.1 hypothetical protein [Escherichia coli]